MTARIHLGAQVLANSGMPFGVIPAGTGNDFARGLGVPLKDPVRRGRPDRGGRDPVVDLATAKDEFITTVVAGGFDSLVNKRANAMTLAEGQLPLHLATLAELRTFKPLKYVVTVDGEVIETEAMLVAVGTGPTYGGGLQICAGAEIDDGLLDVTIIKPVSRLTLLQMFPKLSKGTHVGHPMRADAARQVGPPGVRRRHRLRGRRDPRRPPGRHRHRSRRPDCLRLSSRLCPPPVRPIPGQARALSDRKAS